MIFRSESLEQVGHRKAASLLGVSHLHKGGTPGRTPESRANTGGVPVTPPSGPLRVRVRVRIRVHTHKVLGRTVGHSKDWRGFPVSYLFEKVGHHGKNVGHRWGGGIMSQSLRDEMPGVAAFIDDLRSAFGKDEINDQVRAGLKGKPTFHATENGYEIGTPFKPEQGIKLSETIVGPMALKKRGAP